MVDIGFDAALTAPFTRCASCAFLRDRGAPLPQQGERLGLIPASRRQRLADVVERGAGLLPQRLDGVKAWLLGHREERGSPRARRAPPALPAPARAAPAQRVPATLRSGAIRPPRCP